MSPAFITTWPLAIGRKYKGDGMKNENKKLDGLPEVAQDDKQKKLLVLSLIAFMVIMVLCAGFFNKTEKKISKPIEETYAIQTDESAETKKPEPVVNSTVPVATPKPQLNPEVVQQQIALIQQKRQELQQRLVAPLMLVNTNQSNTATAASQSTPASKDSNMQFMNQVSAQASETTIATAIGPLNKIIAEGNFIHAILEPATNSDLPGYLRASVSEPAYSEDGSQVLVPRGSRLIGQYKSGMMQGQSRIFIVWTRLITPEGISVQLGSPGIDSLGVAGMGADEIDRHFWQRFGTASLLSLIGAGAANVGVNGQDQNNSAASYREAIANSFAQTAEQTLQQEIMIAPTLKSYQGKPIMVFVAHDLNFQHAMQQTNRKMNVF